MGNKEFGIDLETIKSITKQISLIYKKGIKISLVVGGGNIFRGISASSDGLYWNVGNSNKFFNTSKLFRAKGYPN